jgi:hypothetical protein
MLDHDTTLGALRRLWALIRSTWWSESADEDI